MMGIYSIVWLLSRGFDRLIDTHSQWGVGGGLPFNPAPMELPLLDGGGGRTVFFGGFLGYSLCELKIVDHGVFFADGQEFAPLEFLKQILCIFWVSVLAQE